MLDFVTDYIKFGKRICIREKYFKGFVDIKDNDYIPIHALKNISSDRNSYEDISEELDHNWRVFLKHFMDIMMEHTNINTKLTFVLNKFIIS